MTATPKVKISVSLDADVVEAVDALAAREGSSRSAVMERWLRQISRRAKLTRLEEETAAYYDALDNDDKQEDAAWAAAASSAAARLDVDESAASSGMRRRPGTSATTRRPRRS